jgi:hypothetical protein
MDRSHVSAIAAGGHGASGAAVRAAKWFAALAISIILACFVEIESAHAATVTVSGNTVIDSATGLQWQTAEVSSATLATPASWTIASGAQVDKLAADINQCTVGLECAFSASIAQPLSILEGVSYTPNQALYQPYALTLDSSGISFMVGIQYYQEGPVSSGYFGPCTYTAGVEGPTTQPTVLAWEVTPVPVPSAAWLLLSGLGGLALSRKRCSPPAVRP